jgi:hypothetical protein
VKFRKEKKDSDNSKNELEAPVSLPDSLIEQYGLPQKLEKKLEDPQRLPDDLISTSEYLEKIHDDSSKIEYIKEEKEVEEKKEEAQDDEPEEEMQSESEEAKELAEIKKEYEELASKEVTNKKAKHLSFFEELELKLKDEHYGMDAHFTQGLAEMMKKYHLARTRGEHFFFHEQDLEDALYKKMLKLKEIENEWVIRAKEYNAAKELLEDKEEEINKLSNELIILIKNADKFKAFNKTTTHDTAFKLRNGKILLSINDLLKELHMMHDEEFHHYVNEHKNDFAEWIHHVFRQVKLSELIKKCPTRVTMIETLGDY